MDLGGGLHSLSALLVLLLSIIRICLYCALYLCKNKVESRRAWCSENSVYWVLERLIKLVVYVKPSCHQVLLYSTLFPLVVYTLQSVDIFHWWKYRRMSHSVLSIKFKPIIFGTLTEVSLNNSVPSQITWDALLFKLGPIRLLFIWTKRKCH